MNNSQNPINLYIENPTDELHIKQVKIGRIVFEDIIIKGRQGAINFQETMIVACEKTKSRRLRKNGTRYPAPLPMGTPGRLLQQEIDDYLRSTEINNLRATTTAASARTLAVLKIVCGNIPVCRIDHTHIYQMWDLLRWSPGNIRTEPALQGLTVEELIQRGKALSPKPPAVATFELHRRLLAAFFNKLVKAHAIPYSPMDAFKEMKKDLIQDESKPERLFSKSDLRRIFNPTTFIPWASKFPHRWWCTILGLYTGARINEIAQLKVSDIIQEEGHWCLAIRKTVDEDLRNKTGARSRQALKGKSAVRNIPIAQAVIDAGFLAFVEDMRAFKHPRLFPHLSAGENRKTGQTNARYSQGLAIQFGTYLKELGFPKGVAFHAFRHTFATMLDEAGVTSDAIAMITGHSLSGRNAPGGQSKVLEDVYFHRTAKNTIMRRLEVLATFKPGVILPCYKRGQFKGRLGRDAKVYP